MIISAKKNGLDVAMNTNGILLNEKRSLEIVENLSWIRISLNAGTAKSYAKIHQTQESDFQKVLDNIKQLVELKESRKSNITIGIQTVLLNENAAEIAQLASTLKQIGVDYYSIKPFLKHPETSWTTELDNKKEIIDSLVPLEDLSDDKFSFRMRQANFTEQTERGYKKCLSSEFMIEVDARGDIYSCGPYIGKAEHRFGNILNYSFKDVWHSDECRERVAYIQNHVDVSKCMPNCRPNAVNEELWKLKNPPQHINFI